MVSLLPGVKPRRSPNSQRSRSLSVESEGPRGPLPPRWPLPASHPLRPGQCSGPCVPVCCRRAPAPPPWCPHGWLCHRPRASTQTPPPVATFRQTVVSEATSLTFLRGLLPSWGLKPPDLLLIDFSGLWLIYYRPGSPVTAPGTQQAGSGYVSCEGTKRLTLCTVLA